METPKTIRLKAVLLAGVGALLSHAQPGAADEPLVRATVVLALPKYFATGVIVDAGERLVLTSRHVVPAQEDVVVFFPEFAEGKLIQADDHYLTKAPRAKGRIVHREQDCDLALVRMPSLPPGSQAVSLAEKPAAVGELLRLCGHPSNRKQLWIFREGKVRRRFKGSFDYKEKDVPLIQAQVLEMDFATFYGDSGGPVVNARGELVGLHMGANLWVERDDLTLEIDLEEIRAFLQRAKKALASEKE